MIHSIATTRMGVACVVLAALGAVCSAKAAVNVPEHHNHDSRDGLYVDPAFTPTAAAALKRDLGFNDGWQARQGGIGFGDLQWALTGERLTAESFARYRKLGGFVAIHSIPEEVVRLALSNPLVMVASDGVLDEGKGHPRAAGTFSRVLGRYVREQRALRLM